MNVDDGPWACSCEARLPGQSLASRHCSPAALSGRLLAAPVLFALTMGTILTASTSSRADVEPKRVLMLHSFGLRFKPWTDYAQFIRAGITRGSQTPVDFHDHSLLNARLADDKADAPFVDYLHALYADKPPDLILAIGAPAANFVQWYPERIFPEPLCSSRPLEALPVPNDKLTLDDTVVAAALRLSRLLREHPSRIAPHKNNRNRERGFAQ